MNQWRKGIASWTVGKTLYLSVPFTWLMKDAEEMAKAHKGKVVAGGPAVKLMGAPWAETPDAMAFDALSFHNPLATFTTRGCPNRCSFCAVPKIEGDFRELADWRPAPTICDNNLLAATKKHFKKVIDGLTFFVASDFNQGLDARLFSAFHADQLSRLSDPHIRFSWDSIKTESAVADAIALCKHCGFKRISVYCLIGYKDTPEDARYRVEKVIEWGALPNPMRYQPLDCAVKNSYIGEHWTQEELFRFSKYFSRLNHLRHIPYDDFMPQRTAQESLPLSRQIE